MQDAAVARARVQDGSSTKGDGNRAAETNLCIVWNFFFVSNRGNHRSPRRPSTKHPSTDVFKNGVGKLREVREETKRMRETSAKRRLFYAKIGRAHV